MRLLLAAALTIPFMTAHAANAQDCSAGKPGSELSSDEAQSIYDCLADSMHEGYQKGDKRWIDPGFVSDYRDWKAAGTAPAAPGFHGGRFLITYVNDAGWDAYTDYASEGANMPTGTVIAKESFTVGDDGKAKAGPLFLMHKVGREKSPETSGWYYMMVAPNGAPQAVPVMSACNECHSNFGEEQDFLGYPVEEVRIAK